MIKIKSSIDSIYDFSAISIMGIFLSSIGVWILWHNKILFGVVTIFFSLRITTYKVIELIFSKTIFIENSRIVLKVGPAKFFLSEESVIKIKYMFTLAPNYGQKVTLNIYRNPKCFWKKIFKNTIRLNVVDIGNMAQMEQLATRVSDTFGFKFVDNFEIDD